MKKTYQITALAVLSIVFVLAAAFLFRGQFFPFPQKPDVIQVWEDETCKEFLPKSEEYSLLYDIVREAWEFKGNGIKALLLYMNEEDIQVITTEIRFFYEDGVALKGEIGYSAYYCSIFPFDNLGLIAFSADGNYEKEAKIYRLLFTEQQIERLKSVLKKTI